MFRGNNRPSRQQIFGPSSTGGSWADARQDQLYMRGEGLGSFFGSMFRKIVPVATKTFKKIAGSKFVQDSGKQLLDGGMNALANVAADAISGDKDISESVSEQVKNARKEISSSIRKANKRRKYTQLRDDHTTTPTKRKKKKLLPKARKKTTKYDIFDDEE